MQFQKIFLASISCLTFTTTAWAIEPQGGAGNSDVTIPVVVDEKAPQSYLERMFKKLGEFEANLHKKQATMVIEDDIAKIKKDYQEFQEDARLKIHGSLTNQTAAHIYAPRYFSKFDTQLYLSGAGEISEKMKYFISGRYHYNPVFDVSDRYSNSARSDEKTDVELRDTYLDWSVGDVDLRLGKQQVVWGEAVGLFFADVVNAKDLRESVLPDFEFIRIPEWGASAEYTKDDFHSQFIVLPGVEFDKTGVQGAEFSPPVPIPNATTPFTTHDPDQPKYGFENSKIGARFSYLISGVDAGVFYLHSWTSLPVMYRSIDGNGSYNFDPTYERQDIFGLTFSKEVNDYVCKGEAVFYPKAYFPINDTTDSDGIKKSGYVDYLIGLDHTYFGKWDVNFQLMQRWVMDYDNRFMNEEEVSYGFSVRLARTWVSQKLTTEILAITNLRAPDFLYRPKVSYNLSNSWKVAVGADIFAGQPTGLFGFFREKSRWYTEFTYKF